MRCPFTGASHACLDPQHHKPAQHLLAKYIRLFFQQFLCLNKLSP
jgi:hypothetical protein